MSDPGATPAADPRRSGTWTMILLITLGLLPFVVSLAVVWRTRAAAEQDPKAKKWIEEHAGSTKLLGNRAK